MKKYNTFREIIDLWPNRGIFGRAIGTTQSYANTLYYRDTLPSTFWPAVIREAKKIKLDGINYEVLAQLQADRRHG